MTNIWAAVLISVVSGIVAALLAPIITESLHMRNWRRQRRLELQYQVFQEAVTALARLLADALDPELQRSTGALLDVDRDTRLRPLTSESLEATRGMVAAFFSQDTAGLFEQAQRTRISIQTVPNIDFETARRNAVVAMTRELGVFDP